MPAGQRTRDLKRTNGRSRVPRRSAFQSDDQTKLQRCFCLFLHLDALTSSVELPQLAGWRNGLEELDDDMLSDGDGTACAPCHTQSEREGVKGENWAALAGGSLNSQYVLKARICVIAELPLSTGEIWATAELEIDRIVNTHLSDSG